MTTSGKGAPDKPVRPAGEDPQAAAEFLEQRRAMVYEQIRDRGITSPRVLEAMLAVPRHKFVPPELVRDAYKDQPLPLGEGQTISQPFKIGRASCSDSANIFMSVAQH